MTDLFTIHAAAIGGMRIIESLEMADDVLDWSGCRSIPRAARRASAVSRRGRAKKRHPQRCRWIKVPRQTVFVSDHPAMMIMHPTIAAALRADLERDRWHVVG